jgi:membrane-associated phospholipid phosphatase
MNLLNVTASWFTGIDLVDRKLFFIVNRQWSNSYFDAVLPYLRESNIWVPLYLFFIAFVLINYGGKGWWWILGAICTAALSDMVSSSLIKGNVFRLRPCQNPEIAHQLRFLVNYCPRSSSFTSSHATNHFAFAMFVVATLKQYTHPWLNLLFLWAGVICYAQVYVGVHYPIDVFCGAILGCLLGAFTARLYNKFAVLNPLSPKIPE